MATAGSSRSRALSRALFAPKTSDYLRYFDAFTSFAREERVVEVAWGGACGAYEDGGPVLQEMAHLSRDLVTRHHAARDLGGRTRHVGDVAVGELQAVRLGDTLHRLRGVPRGAGSWLLGLGNGCLSVLMGIGGGTFGCNWQPIGSPFVLGIEGEASEVLSPERSLPAVGQGALAVEQRAGDAEVQALLAPISHPESGYLDCVAGRERAESLGPVAAWPELIQQSQAFVEGHGLAKREAFRQHAAGGFDLADRVGLGQLPTWIERWIMPLRRQAFGQFRDVRGVDHPPDVRTLAGRRRARDPGQLAEGLGGRDGPVGRPEPGHLARPAGDLRPHMTAQLPRLIGRGRIAGEPGPGQPARAERQRDRHVGHLVDADGDLQRAAADVEHENLPRGPAEPPADGQEGQPRLFRPGQHRDVDAGGGPDRGEDRVPVGRVTYRRGGEREQLNAGQ